jgi:signal transduction histidine kinase
MVAVPLMFLSAVMDEAHRTQESLRSIGAKLINAQDQERSRIARELHDDYNQRLAMLAIDLEKLARNIHVSSIESTQQLHEMRDRVCEVSTDLHTLSHSLHSSTLETLGLVAGLRASCREFAEQQSLQVDFVHGNIPRGVPADAALCLFRVAQEALRNVNRHSGAHEVVVQLELLGAWLRLSVSDRGIGFDRTAAGGGGWYWPS